MILKSLRCNAINFERNFSPFCRGFPGRSTENIFNDIVTLQIKTFSAPNKRKSEFRKFGTHLEDAVVDPS